MILFNIVLEVFPVQSGKNIKGKFNTITEKKGVKHSLFTHDIIGYVKNPERCIKNMTNIKYLKVTVYTANI